MLREISGKIWTCFLNFKIILIMSTVDNRLGNEENVPKYRKLNVPLKKYDTILRTIKHYW